MTRKATKRKTSKEKVSGFQVVDNECIWMKAGVVNFKLCDNAYDCHSCPFDQSMRSAMESKDPASKVPAWAEHFRKANRGSSRRCRHYLTGRTQAPVICSLNYECYHCAFDQRLDDVELMESPGMPSLSTASGFRLANDYYYHLGHSWARIEHGGRVRVGLDDFLVKIFSPDCLKNPPALGSTLEQGQVGWTINRDDRQAGVLTPLSGTVLAVNQAVREHPEIAHEDPYNEGWLFVIEPADLRNNLKGLFFGEESFRRVEKESQALMKLIGPKYEHLTATGGEALPDIFGNFPGIGWDRLVQMFLHTEG